MKKFGKKIVVFENQHELSIYLLKRWMDWAQKAVLENGRFCAALQGGEPLKEFISKLSTIQDYQFWGNIHLFQTDQYHVFPHHPQNQFQFLKNNLLNYINIPSKNIHPIVTHTDHPAYSADQYQEDLTHFFELPVNGTPIFDCVILGLNDIHHIKTIFQKDSKILSSIIYRHQNNLDLISIHPEILAQARNVIFIGSEGDSSNAYEMIEVLGKDCVNSENQNCVSNQNIVFLLDSIAANKLTQNYKYSNEEHGVVLFL